MITMREAAINAGFPASSAHTRAYEMTNPEICPHVVRATQLYRDELDEKIYVNYKRHLKDLQTIRDRALENGAYSALFRLSIEEDKHKVISILINLRLDMVRLIVCLKMK